MPTVIHWLDTNVFIQAKNGPYRFKVAPGFWAFLDEQASKGNIRCPKMVYDELIDNEEPRDELALWIKNRRQSGLFVAATHPVQVVMRTVADHVSGKYQQHHAAEFLRGADPWLVAHALHSKGVVVTHESDRKLNAKKVRIPNICAELRVPCINTYEMLDKLGAEFGGSSNRKGR